MKLMQRFSGLVLLLLCFSSQSLIAQQAIQGTTQQAIQNDSMEHAFECTNVHDTINIIEGDTRFKRTVCADVVALDQMLVYNRFGSFNPFGMMYALRRDVVSVGNAPEAIDADACDASLGIESHSEVLSPGEVRLRDCKRPRPLTLRANVGDIMHIRLSNLLRRPPPDFSDNYCNSDQQAIGPSYGESFHFIRPWLSEGDGSQLAHGEVSCKTPVVSENNAEKDLNWPHTRGINLAIQGLRSFVIESGALKEAPDVCKGIGTVEPGSHIDCYYQIEREGPFFMASTGAPSGGQGDGGSLVHGLFGAVVAEPIDTRWYRSQVSKATFSEVWSQSQSSSVRHAIASGDVGDLNRYAATAIDPVSGEELPLLEMLNATDEEQVFKLLHSDLNAIIYRPQTNMHDEVNFREFSVFFHDELKTFYTRNFEELGEFGGGQLAGVRDGFAINYGASGMGDLLLANRKGIGPAANCKECLYEEFFLASWANGDPALLEQYSEDPSNVHHSYLNDRTVFRNFHAGPKETHVFHLHAHQWFSGNDAGRGAYLDSQTVGPQQGFSYDIYQGGMEVYHPGGSNDKGWFETLGSGNRNRTVGDSIFHCHLYPHFAQGMWELWRVHDVLEDGSRKLPDGQWEPTLSLAEMNAVTRAKKRPGSVDQSTGRWIAPGEGLTGRNIGTPVPGLVPLPDSPWPLLPSYPDADAELSADGNVTADPIVEFDTFPGYPYYIAALPGHRPPQAPMDIARALSGNSVTDEFLDGGLPRHVVTDNATRALPFELPESIGDRLATGSGAADLAAALASPTQLEREALQSQVFSAALALGDMTMKLKSVEVDLLEYDGEPIERAAMAFHHDGTLDGGSNLDLRDAAGNIALYDGVVGGYSTTGGNNLFAVNGAPAKPGAPFADPCGAPSSFGQIIRESASSYRFETGGSSFPVLAVPALEMLVNGDPATDTEVSNWVEHWRTDIHENGPPQLYYDDASGTPQLVERGAHVFEQDPFLNGLPDTGFTADPAVVGYRRYEGSAVQVDLVTNRAGWHDPQARINVLSRNSDQYKDGGGRLSPRVTASEEPFFFRAVSGECIEFRHTNELPKDLELDDFQVKTPTDTIGQHIHLVKFDVTSSDGSGNGFNYEDGTLAPDEIAARICAAKNSASAALITPTRAPGELLMREFPNLCSLDAVSGLWKVSDNFKHSIWRKKLSMHRDLFQTTTQRWFADPILSDTRAADDDTNGVGKADRTLRTVFSHDHFGPSSIQQHGFYTALIIEPQVSQICNEAGDNCTAPRTDRELESSDERHVGARKVMVDLMPVDNHEFTDDGEMGAIKISSYREFALSIADFATLYDPRHRNDVVDVGDTIAGGEQIAMKGMMTLACEAVHAISGKPKRMNERCESALSKDTNNSWNAKPDDVAPAWLAAARPGDTAPHREGMEPSLWNDLRVDYHGSLLSADDFLIDYLTDFRQKAAGYDPDSNPSAPLANPVSPPARPESISVDHHDPYLVNYRGEPYPLRLGEDSDSSSNCALRPLSHWVSSLQTGVTEACEISQQKADDAGDPANVMLSAYHGDPVTPIFEAFDNEPMQFRLIQGAQEVQHTFTVEGRTWPRHLDQYFPSAMKDLDNETPEDTLVRACETTPGALSAIRMARAGRPDQFKRFASQGPASFTDPTVRNFWEDMKSQLADCFNTDGRIAAQEIGISEHFEFRAAMFANSNFEGVGDHVEKRLDEQRIPRTPEELLEWLEGLIDQLTRRLAATDTPYHFGSQDAVWNGAWGLIRVAPNNRKYIAYTALREILNNSVVELSKSSDDLELFERKLEELRPYFHAPLDTIVNKFPELATDPQLVNFERELIAPDAFPSGDEPSLLFPLDRIRDEAIRGIELLPSEEREAIRGRLRFLDQEFARIDTGGQSAATESALQTKIPEYEQVADCPTDAPNVYTAVIAIEAETVFGTLAGGKTGTPYSDELFDRNGLFFALIDPRILIDPLNPEGVTDIDIEDRSKWTSILLSEVIAAIQNVYERPEPLVINVNAGDCVYVTLLNAMKDQQADHPGLADATGDALMPGITSLNVERAWDEQPWEMGDTENTLINTATTGDRKKDVVPSSRLAVTLPLPILTSQRHIARPYGRNRVWALNGIPSNQADPTLTIEDADEPYYKPRHAQIEQFRFYAGFAYADYRTRNAPLPIPALADLSTLNLIGALGLKANEQKKELNLPGVISQLPFDNNQADSSLGEQIKLYSQLRSDTVKQLEDFFEKVGLDPKDIMRPVRTAALQALAKQSPLTPEQRQILFPVTNIVAEKLPGVDGIAIRLPGEADTLDIASLDTAIAGLIVQQGEAAAVSHLNDIGDILRPFILERDRLLSNTFGLSNVQKELNTHFVPYAFGALPIKSFGDFIGHPAHGLIGAVTVAPQHAQITQVRGPKQELAVCENPLVFPIETELDLESLRRRLPRTLRLFDLGAAQASSWLDLKKVQTVCAAEVIAPERSTIPFWSAHLSTPAPGSDSPSHDIRQFTLFWQDGLNLRDGQTEDSFMLSGNNEQLVADCLVCDDSYDRGDKGVSYRSEPFHVRLRNTNSTPIESHFNLNGKEFGNGFFRLQPDEIPTWDNAPMPVLRANAGEEVVVHVVHPGGRARQRAFATIALDYDDIFPGFGFARAALLAPGKAITASITRPVEAGCYLWFDGPLHLRAGGVWGLLDVVEPGSSENTSSCAAR